jgi:hypothetical protein
MAGFVKDADVMLDQGVVWAAPCPFLPGRIVSSCPEYYIAETAESAPHSVSHRY